MFAVMKMKAYRSAEFFSVKVLLVLGGCVVAVLLLLSLVG